MKSNQLEGIAYIESLSLEQYNDTNCWFVIASGLDAV